MPPILCVYLLIYPSTYIFFFQSNLSWSDPIQSNPVQSNPIQSSYLYVYIYIRMCKRVHITCKPSNCSVQWTWHSGRPATSWRRAWYGVWGSHFSGGFPHWSWFINVRQCKGNIAGNSHTWSYLWLHVWDCFCHSTLRSLNINNIRGFQHVQLNMAEYLWSQGVLKPTQNHPVSLEAAALRLCIVMEFHLSPESFSNTKKRQTM